MHFWATRRTYWVSVRSVHVRLIHDMLFCFMLDRYLPESLSRNDFRNRCSASFIIPWILSGTNSHFPLPHNNLINGQVKAGGRLYRVQFYWLALQPAQYAAAELLRNVSIKQGVRVNGTSDSKDETSLIHYIVLNRNLLQQQIDLPLLTFFFPRPQLLVPN
jgi:hypothetical protein